VAQLVARLLWGTFATTAGGGNREQKGGAAVEILRGNGRVEYFGNRKRADKAIGTIKD